MKIIINILVFAVMISGAGIESFAGDLPLFPWQGPEKSVYSYAAGYAEGAYLSWFTQDYMQTRSTAIKYPDTYSEDNPVLGKHPSEEKLTAYFIGVSAVQYKIFYELPEAWRLPWAVAFLIPEITLVEKNRKESSMQGISSTNYPATIAGSILLGTVINKYGNKNNHYSVSIQAMPGSRSIGPVLSMKW